MITQALVLLLTSVWFRSSFLNRLSRLSSFRVVDGFSKLIYACLTLLLSFTYIIYDCDRKLPASFLTPFRSFSGLEYFIVCVFLMLGGDGDPEDFLLLVKSLTMDFLSLLQLWSSCLCLCDPMLPVLRS